MSIHMDAPAKLGARDTMSSHYTTQQDTEVCHSMRTGPSLKDARATWKLRHSR